MLYSNLAHALHLSMIQIHCKSQESKLVWPHTRMQSQHCWKLALTLNTVGPWKMQSQLPELLESLEGSSSMYHGHHITCGVHHMYGGGRAGAFEPTNTCSTACIMLTTIFLLLKPVIKVLQAMTYPWSLFVCLWFCPSAWAKSTSWERHIFPVQTGCCNWLRKHFCTFSLILSHGCRAATRHQSGGKRSWKISVGMNIHCALFKCAWCNVLDAT